MSNTKHPQTAVDDLPLHVLEIIAEFVRSRGAFPEFQLPLFELAFAAPVFYAPCLRLAIRRAKLYIPYFPEKDADPESVRADERIVGMLLSNADGTWSLVLLYRTMNRKRLSSNGSSEPASRRWSRLHVPLRQLHYFEISRNYAGTIPPRCKSLLVANCQVPWKPLVFPDSLAKLKFKLVQATAQKGAFAKFLKRLQGSQLRELILFQSMLMDAGDTIANIVVHLPPTVTTLNLSPAFGTILPVLAATITRLPLLASLTITSDLANGDALCAVFNALPRNTQPLNLNVDFLASNRSFVLHWDALKASLPPAVRSFSLGLSLTDLDDDGDTDWIESPLAQVFPDMLTKLPVATDSLRLRLPTFGFDGMCDGLTLAPTLQTLTLMWGRHNWSWSNVADLAARLPPLLTQLALVHWPLSGEVASVVWPPHLMDLSLPRCDLSTRDMDALAGRWPEHLRRLDLKSNRIQAGVKGLPVGLRELDLHGNRDLGGEDVTWIAALPPALCVLNLAGTRVDGATAGAIMARPEPWRLPRLQVTMGRWSVPRDVLEALRQKVDLLAV